MSANGSPTRQARGLPSGLRLVNTRRTRAPPVGLDGKASAWSGSSSSRVALIVGGDHTSAPEIDAAAVHAFAVEGHRDAAAAVDGNQAAAAAEAGDLRQGGAAGPGERFAPIAHAGRDVEREHRAQEELAVAGAGDGARGVVGVDAGADDRRIADAARELAGGAAGGGRRREVACAIEGHRSDRAVL